MNKGDHGYATVSRFQVKCPVRIRRILADGRVLVEVTKTTQHIYRRSRFVISRNEFVAPD